MRIAISNTEITENTQISNSTGNLYEINKKTPLALLCSLGCAGEENNLLSNVCLGFFGTDATLFWQITRKPENHSVKMSQAPPKPSNFYLERGILVRSVRTPKTVKIRIDFDSKL